MIEQKSPVVDVTALRDCFVRSVPFQRNSVPLGRDVLNALAEIFDLPLDCFGLDISIRIDEVLKISVHRYPEVRGGGQ